MSVAIAATVVAGSRGRITVTVTGEPAGTTMTVWRDDLSGALVPVVGASGIKAESTVIDDPRVRLNRPTWWRVTLSSGAQAITAASVTATSPLPLVSDPVTGEAVEVTIKDWPQLEYPQRTTVLDIDGRRQRLRLHAIEGTPSSKVTLITVTGPQLVAVRTLVADGRDLLIRGSDPGIEDADVALIGTRTETRVTMRASDWRRTHEWEVEHVEEPTPDRTGGDTLEDLYEAVGGATSTLGSIAATWATLGAIAAADLRGM